MHTFQMQRTVTSHAPEDQFTKPSTWGEDEVTHFLSTAERNSYYTVNRNRAAVRRLRKAVDLFKAGADEYSRVRGVHDINDERFFRFDTAIPFYMSCRISLFAAITLAFGQQLADAAKPARGALEAALYGYHVFNDPEAWGRWAERPLISSIRGRETRETERRARSAVGREFSVTSIARELGVRHTRLAVEANDLYDELIDFGGHFNMPTLRAMGRVSTTPHSTTVHFTVIGGDDQEIRETLDRILRTASLSLRVFTLVFDELWQRSRLTDKIRAFTLG